MTQPIPAGAPPSTGSTPAAWGLAAPLPAAREVPLYGAPERGLFYVRSPVTGDVRGVSKEEASALVFQSGWEPVVEPDAVRLLERQISREQASPIDAALYGGARGLSGGLVELVLPQGEEPGALSLQGVREEYPGTALAGEIAGSLLPLSRAAGAARFASPVALAEAAGGAATRRIAGAAPGVGRSVAARAAGTALEGGVIGSTYTAGESSIEDSPLTAQKIAGGFLAGAIPGAIIGAPLGAVEGITGSLGSRYASRSKHVRDEVSLPAVSDADLMKIAHREHGVAVPGMIEELQAAIQRDPNLAPDFFQLAQDKGAVGKAVREQLHGAEALRGEAEKRAAAGLNAVQDLDDLAIEAWIHGQPKKELIKQWLKDAAPGEVDFEAALAEARRYADSPRGRAELGDLERREFAASAAAQEPLAPAGVPTRANDPLAELRDDLARADAAVANAEDGAERIRAMRWQKQARDALDEAAPRGEDRATRVDLDEGSTDTIAAPPRRPTMVGVAPDEAPRPTVPDEAPQTLPGELDRQTRELDMPEDGVTEATQVTPSPEAPWDWREGMLSPAQNDNYAPRVESPTLVDDAGPNTIVDMPSRAASINTLVGGLEAAAAADDTFRASLVSKLGTTEEDLGATIARGMAARDDNVTAALSEAMQQASQRAKEAFDLHAYQVGLKSQNARAWKVRGMQLIDDLGNEADQLTALSPGVLGQAKSEARKVRDLLANARAKFASNDRVEAFAALDELKARLGPHAKPDAWLGQDDNVAKMVRRGYEDVRQLLEDPNLWGVKAATAQREMNELFHKRMARADGYFKQFFDDAGVPHPRNPWVNLKRATPEKVRGALKGIIDPSQSESYGLFAGHVAETRKLAAKMREFYNLTPEADAQLSQLLKGVDEAEESLGKAVLFARREAQANALFNNRANVVPGYAKWIALGLLGPAGFAAVKVAENVANPGQRIFFRASLERALRGSESRMARGVLGLVTGKTVKFPEIGATQLAARASASLLHEKDPKKRAQDYAATLAELTKLSTPEAAGAAAKNAIPFAVGTLPEAPAYLGLMLSRASRYLIETAPVRPRLTPRGIEVDLPSDAELVSWERRYSGAMDPISALEDAMAGHGSVEAIQAAEVSAPELVQEIRGLVLQQLGQGEINYARAIDVSIVLGIPLDRTLEPEYIGSQQMIHAARFKESEATASRRTGGEDGVNAKYKSNHQGKADRVESDVAPK